MSNTWTGNQVERTLDLNHDVISPPSPQFCADFLLDSHNAIHGIVQLLIILLNIVLAIRQFFQQILDLGLLEGIGGMNWGSAGDRGVNGLFEFAN
jgi:hypothetical protein